MLSSTVRGLFRRSSPRPSQPAPPTFVSRPRTAPTPPAEAPIGRGGDPDRLAGRAAGADQQPWGAGFIFPGGEIETLRLTRPLGLSAAASLLIVGVGSGGPASAVTRNLGAWVTGMDTDPSLLAAARAIDHPGATDEESQHQGLGPGQSGVRSQIPSSLPGSGVVSLCASRTDPGRPGRGTEARRPDGAHRTGGPRTAGPRGPHRASLGRTGMPRSGQCAPAAHRDPHAGAGRPRCSRRRGHLPAPSGARDARLARGAARPRPQTHPAGGRAIGAGGGIVAAAAAADPRRPAADDALARDQPHHRQSDQAGMVSPPCRPRRA